jgi:hypothetical protein
MDSTSPQAVASSSSPGVASHAPASKPAASPLRLGILLLVLALCVAALAYDYKVAKPASEAANAKLMQFMEVRNQMSVKEGGPVTRAEVQKELGRRPTWVEEEPTYTVEWYCWWGKTPLLSTRRHYLTVLYVGDERRFSAQNLNGPPAEDDLPTHFVVQLEGNSDKPLGDPGNSAPPTADSGPPLGAPASAGPGMGGKRKGKGKGRGKGPAGETADSTNAADSTSGADSTKGADATASPAATEPGDKDSAGNTPPPESSESDSPEAKPAPATGAEAENQDAKDKE